MRSGDPGQPRTRIESGARPDSPPRPTIVASGRGPAQRWPAAPAARLGSSERSAGGEARTLPTVLSDGPAVSHRTLPTVLSDGPAVSHRTLPTVLSDRPAVSHRTLPTVLSDRPAVSHRTLPTVLSDSPAVSHRTLPTVLSDGKRKRRLQLQGDPGLVSFAQHVDATGQHQGGGHFASRREHLDRRVVVQRVVFDLQIHLCAGAGGFGHRQHSADPLVQGKGLGLRQAHQQHRRSPARA